MSRNPVEWVEHFSRDTQRIARFFGRSDFAAAKQEAAVLVPWYLKNRVRAMALPLEQKVWGHLDGASQPPQFITIKPTFRCNLRCEFCRYVVNGAVFGKADYFLDDEWLDLIDEVAPFKPYISITGGEPLLYPKIGELLERIAKNGLKATMVTNGTLLERKAEAIMNAPPKIMQISIDGPQDVHNQLRMVNGTFEKAQAGIARILELKKQRKSPYPILLINSVISGSNYRGMPRMVEVAKNLGADVLNFQHFWFMTDAMLDSHNNQWGECFPVTKEEMGTIETTGVDVDELFDLVCQVEQTRELPVLIYPKFTKREMQTYYNAPEEFIRARTPKCAWLQTAIFPNGDVSPCFDHIVGNIRDQSFMDIWDGERFRAHRMRLAQHGPYSLCARCCVFHRND